MRYEPPLRDPDFQHPLITAMRDLAEKVGRKKVIRFVFQTGNKDLIILLMSSGLQSYEGIEKLAESRWGLRIQQNAEIILHKKYGDAYLEG